jgi:hypothetical protein
MYLVVRAVIMLDESGEVEPQIWVLTTIMRDRHLKSLVFGPAG